MSARISTSAPVFVTIDGPDGPVGIALHNVIRFAPDKRSPEDRTMIFSRGHQHTMTVANMPYGKVEALIQKALAEARRSNRQEAPGLVVRQP